MVNQNIIASERPDTLAGQVFFAIIFLIKTRHYSSDEST